MREFPGSPGVETQCFHICGLGSVPHQGTKFLKAGKQGQKKKKKDTNELIYKRETDSQKINLCLPKGKG